MSDFMKRSYYRGVSATRKNTKDYVRKTWDSISDAELGADYIYRVAREYDPSFSDDIQELFSAQVGAGDQTAAPASMPPSPEPNPGGYPGPVPKLMPVDFALHKLPRREYVLGYRFMAGTVSLGIGPRNLGLKIKRSAIFNVQHPHPLRGSASDEHLRLIRAVGGPRSIVPLQGQTAGVDIIAVEGGRATKDISMSRV